MAWGRESSLEAAGTLVAAAPSPGSILHHLGGAGWSWWRCGCQKDPCWTEFQFCRVPRMGGIKLQLLCGLAVGSLPYPRFRNRIVQSPLRLPGRGAYLAPITPLTWGKIPLGIPTYLPMEGVQPNQTSYLVFIDFTAKFTLCLLSCKYLLSKCF